jgi:hypothetical protein
MDDAEDANFITLAEVNKKKRKSGENKRINESLSP